MCNQTKEQQVISDILRSLSPSDESLHSFLLRNLWNFNSQAKPNEIICDDGKFYKYPTVQKEYQHVYSRHQDHILLEMIEIEKTVNGRNNLLFSCPNYSYREIKAVFFNEKRKRTNETIKIRYCLRCIKESILTNGYGYLKYHWNFSDKCLVHGVNLKVINSNSRKESITSLKLVFSGMDSKIYSELTIKDKVLDERKCRVDWIDTNKFYFPIKAASCLKSELAMWFYKNESKINREDIRLFVLRAGFIYILNQDDMVEMKYKENLMGALILCTELIPSLINEFYSEHVEYIGLHLGPRQQGEIKEVFSKRKRVNCATCKDDFCVMKSHPETFHVDPIKLDVNYLKDTSYTLKRILRQGRNIKQSCQYPWGYLDVIPEYDDENIKFQIIEYNLDNKLL